MSSALGWYGPLIDLSQAASHIGHFVQLLVFVHRSTPVQYKLAKGGEAIRTDIQVGDDSRSYFSVSIWQKQMGSLAIAANVVLLQNVKIVKFGDILQATTEPCSSLNRLIDHHESIVSKGIDDLIAESGLHVTTKEKLRKVIEWVRQAGYIYRTTESRSDQNKLVPKNWKVSEETKSRHCLSLFEVSRLTSSCKALFTASVGEIFLPITWRDVCETENEKMFISRRLSKLELNNLAEDLICTGCQLCGSAMDMKHGSSLFGGKPDQYYCEISSNHLHAMTWIYRPFLLYVWDETEYLPLLVRNKAAELLFGNIKAEKVYQSFECQINSSHINWQNIKRNNMKGKENNLPEGNVNLYSIWLILVKMLLQPGKNSPFQFDIAVNSHLDQETGKFEMVSFSIPSL